MKKTLAVLLILTFAISLQTSVVFAESSLPSPSNFRDIGTTIWAFETAKIDTSHLSSFLDVETGLSFKYPDDWTLDISSNIVNKSNSVRVKTKVIGITSSSRMYSMSFTEIKDTGFTIEDNIGNIYMYFSDNLWMIKSNNEPKSTNPIINNESDIKNGYEIVGSVVIK